jgi:hypothetical protein
MRQQSITLALNSMTSWCDESQRRGLDEHLAACDLHHEFSAALLDAAYRLVVNATSGRTVRTMPSSCGCDKVQ